MTTSSPLVELISGYQNYDWGKIGSSSKVAQYSKASKSFQVDEAKPYAEVWMGTHPNVPSVLASNPSTKLIDYLKSNPSYLGSQNTTGDLPFLFKVLSIGKALSIQAHPDKKLGEKLHRDQPKVYKDPNHKPEMALALTPFSGFCGFRPLSEISHFLTSNEYPEFPSVLSHDPSFSIDSFTSASSSSSESDRKDALKSLFNALMTAPEDSHVIPQLRKLVKRLREEKGVKLASNGSPEGLDELILTLNQQFPDDVGVFCTFVLNLVKLKEGEAVFLKANEPHAYLEGDIIECMATSDNVVRAGLTPKLRDVPTLVSMLTYTSLPPSQQLQKPTQFSPHSLLYDPPIDEFSVLLVQVPKSGTEKHRKIDGPSIIIMTSGSGEIVALGEGEEKVVEEKAEREGQIWFIGAGTEIEFKAGEEGMTVYRAFVEGM